MDFTATVSSIGQDEFIGSRTGSLRSDVFRLLRMAASGGRRIINARGSILFDLSQLSIELHEHG
jgi:hypothetical protein